VVRAGEKKSGEERRAKGDGTEVEGEKKMTGSGKK
jgi:hypothetical protein